MCSRAKAGFFKKPTPWVFPKTYSEHIGEHIFLIKCKNPLGVAHTKTYSHRVGVKMMWANAGRFVAKTRQHSESGQLSRHSDSASDPDAHGYLGSASEGSDDSDACNTDNTDNTALTDGSCVKKIPRTLDITRRSDFAGAPDANDAVNDEIVDSRSAETVKPSDATRNISSVSHCSCIRKHI